MDTEPFDEAALLLPSAAAASPPRLLKRLKKASQTTAPTATSPPPPLPPPSADAETLTSHPFSPSSPSPPRPFSADAKTLTPHPSPPSDPSPRLPTPPSADAKTLTPDAFSPSDPSSPPPTGEDDGLDPLFPEPGGLAVWDSHDVALEEEEEEEEEEMLGGGLIEELRRESSAKRRLNMEEGAAAKAEALEVAAKGKRSKRRKKEAPNESAREKKRFEKERRVQVDTIHAESQRLLRETRSASFKPTVQPVYKPISSVLEKIRLRKLEILKKSKTPIEDDDSSAEPASDSAACTDAHRVQEIGADNNDDLKIDDVVDEVGNNCGDLNQRASAAEEEDPLNGEKDLNKCHGKSRNEGISDNSQDNQEDNTQSNDSPKDTLEETQLAPSSPTKSTEHISSEDEGENNDKENIDPSTQNNDENVSQRLQQALGGDSCSDDAILKDFVDDEAEEEDDSDNDMMRFKDEDEDESDENEVFNDLIAAGYEEGEVDHVKRNELHQKWLQQQDAAETDNVLQRLKFGQQEQKELIDQDEDDSEDREDESENEMSYDLTPRNAVCQNSEKAKQMIAKMFTDDNDTYEHSDEEEIEELLARQRISKRDVDSTSFISPLEDENSREVFGLIKKLNIAPQPKRRGKQTTSNLEALMVGGNNNNSSKSSFLGRTVSSTLASSHRSTYRTYVFGRDDNNSRSCLLTSESNSDMTNTNQPRKTAKFSGSQPKPVATSSVDESGASLFHILRRSSITFDEQKVCNGQKSSHMITDSQATYQFSAFKISRRFSRVGAKS